MAVLYVIFEVCVLLAVCYGTYLAFLPKWGSQAFFSRVRLVAVSVDCLLLTLVLLELHNISYYVSIIFNSPLLTLVCANFIILLVVSSSTCISGSIQDLLFSLKGMTDITIVAPVIAVMVPPSCANILILDVYIFSHYWDHTLPISVLLDKAFTDHFFVCVILPNALWVFNIFMSILLLFLLIGLFDILSNKKIQHFNEYPIDIRSKVVTFVFTIGGCCGSAIATWLTYTVVSSVGTSTILYLLEIIPGNFYLALSVLALPLATLYICMEFKFANFKYCGVCFCACVLVTFTMATTAAVMGCALDRPLPPQHCAVGGVDCTSHLTHHAPQILTPPPQPKVLPPFTETPPSQLEVTTSSHIVLSPTPLSSTPLAPPPKVSSPTPLSSIPLAPPPTESAPTSLPKATQRCLEIDRNDPHKCAKLNRKDRRCLSENHLLNKLPYRVGSDVYELNLVKRLAEDSHWKDVAKFLGMNPSAILDSYKESSEELMESSRKLFDKIYDKGYNGKFDFDAYIAGFEKTGKLDGIIDDLINMLECNSISRTRPEAVTRERLHRMTCDEDGTSLNLMKKMASHWRRVARTFKIDESFIFAHRTIPNLPASVVLTRLYDAGYKRELGWQGVLNVLQDAEAGRIYDTLDRALNCVVKD